ncbi:MAG: transposase family protein [Burkholderiales bacterium]|nr:transposase family protein [Burkholderiales bacterium]
MIEPLVTAFEKEENLKRSRYTSLIRQRAEALDVSFITLNRLLLRYYYFGGTKNALLHLPAGPVPGTAGYSQANIDDGNGKSRSPVRRGRKGILTHELGENTFIVTEDDIGDIIDCLKSALRRGRTNIPAVHEEYLATKFRLRHPKIHRKYLEEKHPEPVTLRQFRYYVDLHAQLNEDLAKNLVTYQRRSREVGSLHSSGPGEVYEIDATGGRMYLVTSTDPPISVGTPTIYLLIDRWSRFVPAAYISLRAPSYEEVRHVLLIAFTSREARFKALGVDIDDKRWPIGCVPAVICDDRGPEFMSESMEKAIVNDLRIELTPLPPLCPDGKAIIERFIRELKRRMSNAKLKGVYAERPLDPVTKRVARKAEAAAAHTLADAYRAIIEIIVDHNNRPHSALRERKELSRAGVKPTPVNAYRWGLENISGVRSPPFSDEDYYRLLLATDFGTITNRGVRYKGRSYLPANVTAHSLLAKFTSNGRKKEIRIDKTFPHQLFVVSPRGEWGEFHLDRNGISALGTLTLDEEEAFSGQNSLLWARAEHQSRVSRVAAKSKSTKIGNKRGKASTAEHGREKSAARQGETIEMKKKLLGEILPEEVQSTRPPAPSESKEWARIEEEENRQRLEQIRQHRRKR